MGPRNSARDQSRTGWASPLQDCCGSSPTWARATGRGRTESCPGYAVWSGRATTIRTLGRTTSPRWPRESRSRACARGDDCRRSKPGVLTRLPLRRMGQSRMPLPVGVDRLRSFLLYRKRLPRVVLGVAFLGSEYCCLPGLWPHL